MMRFMDVGKWRSGITPYSLPFYVWISIND